MGLSVWPEYPDYDVSQWENHALLGEQAIGAINAVRRRLTDLRNFQRDVVSNDVQTDAPSSFPSIKEIHQVIPRPDGSAGIEFSQEVAIEEHVTRLSYLADRALTLRDLL